MGANAPTPVDTPGLTHLAGSSAEISSIARIRAGNRLAIEQWIAGFEGATRTRNKLLIQLHGILGRARVFVGITGSFLDGSALRCRYQVALTEAGLRSLPFDDLRTRSARA